MSFLNTFHLTRPAHMLWPLLLAVLSIQSAPALALNEYNQDSITNYEYDAGGNLTRAVSPLDTTANPVETGYQYDALDRPQIVTQPSPAAGELSPKIRLEHDGQDQLISIEDPRLLVTDYAVDGLGNTQAVTSPDSGAGSNTYDEAGNLKSHTDARGKLTTYDYDALNRLIRVNYANFTATDFIYYSDDGNPPSYPGAIGKLISIGDEYGWLHYFYDDNGRRWSKVQIPIQVPIQSNSLGHWTKPVFYSYGTAGTALGHLDSITYPSGNRINYSYDAAGNVNGITLNPFNANSYSTDFTVTTPLMTAIEYTPEGQVHYATWGNDSPAESNRLLRAHDLDGRTWFYPLGHYNHGGMSRYLVFDPAGRIKQMNHLVYTNGVYDPSASLGYAQSFSYDNLGRLTGNTRSSGSQSYSYSYDASGNRTTTNSYTHGIDPVSNRVQNTSGPAPAKSNQYDLAGNLISDGSATYTYSDRGLLQTATKGGVTTSYVYNGLGQRIAKIGPAGFGVAEYVYDEQGHLIGEYDADGTPIQETVYLGDMPIAVLKPEGGAMQIYYIFADHLNTPRMITRATDNQIVWRWDQADPYGAEAPNENPSGLGTFTYNLRFPGQVYDAETGLHYNMHRYYDPKTGTYIQSDPIGLAGGVNTYAYVGDNPVNWVDPKGLDSHSPTTYSFPSSPLTLPLPNTNDYRWIGSPRNKALASGLEQACKSAYNTITGVFSQSNQGDLTDEEIEKIQNVVDEAGRPIEIVGSAAEGTRRGVGTDLPIGKGPGTRSDIDYVAPPSSLPYFEGLEEKLPGIDPNTGIIPGVGNPNIGPVIRIEPK